MASASAGGNLTLYALLDDADGVGDVTSLELWFGGQPSGIDLDVSPDGVGSLEFPVIDPGIAYGKYLLELSAMDAAGNRSHLWPYLTVDPVAAAAPPGEAFARWLHPVAPLRWTELYRSAASSRASSGAPVVFVAGYWNSSLNVQTGGILKMVAYVQPAAAPIQRVEVRYENNPIGISLIDNGLNDDLGAGDGVWGFTLPFPAGTFASPGQIPLEIVAIDQSGRESPPWPYFNVIEN